MNIVNKLTLRHLKRNKKRTLVTIIGTIVSVAMITAVATLSVSFLDLMQRQLIADEGEWHVTYHDVDKEQAAAIGEDEETKKLLLSKDKGYAYLEGSQNVNKPYLFIKAYNETAMEQYPIHLKEGRLPQAKNEVLISEEIDSNAGVTYKIGDTLTLDVGERYQTEFPSQGEVRNQNSALLRNNNGDVIESLSNTEEVTFTVVGVMERPNWEPTWAPGYTVITYIDENDLAVDEKINATTVVKEINNDIFDHSLGLADELQIKAENVQFNNELLRYSGVTDNDAFKSTMYSLSGIIMAIIMIGSISLIYNAFGISVSERSRHLGMLASVGATKRQKRNSVYFEGAVIGAISIPLGFLAGLAGIGITFIFINKIIQGALGITEKLQLVVTPWTIVVASVVSIVTIFISTYIPARRASKISAIDAIRQSQDIKLTGKRVKTSKLVRKIFGIEAEIGLKNLKRNKKRYRVTVFSLVISIFLFLTVSYFTNNLNSQLDMTQQDINFDIELSSDHGEMMDNQFMSAVSNLSEVTSMHEAYQTNASITSWIDKDKISEQIQEDLDEGTLDSSILENGKFQYNVRLISLDDDYLETYAKHAGIDMKKLTDVENPAGILINKTSYYNPMKNKFIETEIYNGKIGDSVALNEMDWETETESYLEHIEIAAKTDKYPVGMLNTSSDQMQLIVSKSVLMNIMDSVEEGTIGHSIYISSNDPLKTQEDIEKIKEAHVSLYNVYQQRQQAEQLLLMMNVFTYGFISLITIISIANIFNTISTSIALRKREFAMLKSVGMTPKAFNKMINYESIFYGVKALLYGLPLSLAFIFLMYLSATNSFDYGFVLPWNSIIVAIIAVFIIVGAAMLYSTAKVRKENIIETLKQENI